MLHDRPCSCRCGSKGRNVTESVTSGTPCAQLAGVRTSGSPDFKP